MKSQAAALLVGVLVVVIGITLWIMRSPKQAPTQNTSTNTPSMTDTPNPDAVAGNYTSNIYRFKLTFPGSWGTVTTTAGPAGIVGAEKVIPKKLVIISQKDSERSLEMYPVKLADKTNPLITDGPWQFMGESQEYAFYATSSGSCAGKPGCDAAKYTTIATEANTIIDSFKAF